MHDENNIAKMPCPIALIIEIIIIFVLHLLTPEKQRFKVNYEKTDCFADEKILSYHLKICNV